MALEPVESANRAAGPPTIIAPIIVGSLNIKSLKSLIFVELMGVEAGQMGFHVPLTASLGHAASKKITLNLLTITTAPSRKTQPMPTAFLQEESGFNSSTLS